MVKKRLVDRYWRDSIGYWAVDWYAVLWCSLGGPWHWEVYSASPGNRGTEPRTHSRAAPGACTSLERSRRVSCACVVTG